MHQDRISLSYKVGKKAWCCALLVGLIASSCAALQVTTWVLKQGELVHGKDTLTVLQAEGYRCYSEPDDTAWRNELKIQQACCAGREQ